MTALDTNVLVRIIVEDDASQVERARAYIQAQERVFISRTVILELGWVLGYYRLSRETIVASIRGVLAVANCRSRRSAGRDPGARMVRAGNGFRAGIEGATR